VTSFRLHTGAWGDLFESARHYDREVKGLGEDFIDQVTMLLRRLTQFPRLGTPVSRKVRVARVRRFPYDIIYTVEPDHIFVLAIGHQHRRPGWWKKRL